MLFLVEYRLKGNILLYPMLSGRTSSTFEISYKHSHIENRVSDLLFYAQVFTLRQKRETFDDFLQHNYLSRFHKIKTKAYNNLRLGFLKNIGGNMLDQNYSVLRT